MQKEYTIVQERERRGWTQQRLADEAHVSRRQIVDAENRKPVPYYVYQSIDRVLRTHTAQMSDLRGTICLLSAMHAKLSGRIPDMQIVASDGVIHGSEWDVMEGVLSIAEPLEQAIQSLIGICRQQKTAQYTQYQAAAPEKGRV